MTAGTRRDSAKWWTGVSAACLPLACGRLGYDLEDLPRPDTRGVATGTGGASGGSSGGNAGANAGGSGGHVQQSTGGATVDSGTGGRGGAGGSAPNTGGAGHADSGIGDGSSGAGGRGPDGGGGRGGATDARPPVEAGFPTCTVTRRWTQTFDSDPTQSDNDNDGTNDWVVRGGAPFPVSELSGGVWHATTNLPAVDSRPLDDFSARTIVDVRFRNLTVPTSHRGAVFWINLNENGPTFSALFASLVGVTGGGQELTLFGKTGTTEVPIAVFSSLPDGFVELHLDIDPVGKSVAAWIGGIARGTYAIPDTGAPNADAFATIISWEGPSEFDEVRISVCSP
jgi:hypothetical protein